MRLRLAGRDVRAVVFDFDGVLADTAAGWARAEEELCRAYSVAYTPELAAATHGVALEDAVVTLTSGAAETVDSGSAAALLRRLADTHVPAGVRALSGAVDALQRLADHVPVGIASNCERPLLEQLLEAIGVAQRVDVVVSATDVAAPKPAPDVYLAATARLGVPPSATLVVEDSATGAAAAVTAGCLVAHFVPATVTEAAPVASVPGCVTTAAGHHHLLAQLGVPGLLDVDTTPFGGCS